MANDPIHQFQIQDLAGPVSIGGYEISFTNSALFMGVEVATITGILIMATAKGSLVPGRLQSVGEVWYEFVHNMVRQVLGHEGKKFFPLVFSLFSFVLVANMLGMFPYFFTVTSHVVVTAALVPLLGHPVLYKPIHIVWLELIIHPTALLVFQDLAASDRLGETRRRRATG